MSSALFAPQHRQRTSGKSGNFVTIDGQSVAAFINSAFASVFKPLSDSVITALKESKEREERQAQRDAQMFETLQKNTEKFSETVREMSKEHSETVRNLNASHQAAVQQSMREAEKSREQLFTLAQAAIQKH